MGSVDVATRKKQREKREEKKRGKEGLVQYFDYSLLAIVILASCISDVFLTKNNILNVLRQITANGILSILSPTSMRQRPKEHHTYRKHRISYHLFFSLIPPSPPDRKPEPHNLPSSISQSIPVQEPHAYHPCRA